MRPMTLPLFWVFARADKTGDRSEGWTAILNILDVVICLPYSNLEVEQVIRVGVMSDISGATRKVGEALLVLPASRWSISATIGFHLPLGFPTTGVFDHITDVAGPYNKIPDINQTNNSVTVLGVC